VTGWIDRHPGTVTCKVEKPLMLRQAWATVTGAASPGPVTVHRGKKTNRMAPAAALAIAAVAAAADFAPPSAYMAYHRLF
jgi:hypothetical protein